MGDPFEDSDCKIITQDVPFPVVLSEPWCSDFVKSQDEPPPVIICAPEITTVIEGGPSTGGGTDNITTVILGPGSWQTNQPFRLLNGIAYAITAIDADEPFADGITLESGAEGQKVNAGITTTKYRTPLALPGPDDSVLWLSKLPMAVSITRPTKAAGYDWALAVGRKSSTYELIFSPQRTLRL